MNVVMKQSRALSRPCSGAPGSTSPRNSVRLKKKVAKLTLTALQTLTSSAPVMSPVNRRRESFKAVPVSRAVISRTGAGYGELEAQSLLYKVQRARRRLATRCDGGNPIRSAPRADNSHEYLLYKLYSVFTLQTLFCV